MERYTTTEMHHNYLDSLIASYPMNDYVKNGKEKKKQRRKKLINKIAFQVMGFILVTAFTLFIVSFEGIIGMIF